MHLCQLPYMELWPISVGIRGSATGPLDPSYTYLIHTPYPSYGRIYSRIVARFLIWKMLSDLRIIFSIRTAIHNVLVASTTDVMCPWGHYEKIKPPDFSVKALRILSVIDICSSSVAHLSVSLLSVYPSWMSLWHSFHP